MGDDSRLRGCGFELLVPYTGRTFFALICCKNCIVGLKRLNLSEKDAGVGPLKTLFTNFTIIYCFISDNLTMWQHERFKMWISCQSGRFQHQRTKI